MPNGAQALMKTLVNAGIEVCFSNPGTSEMHFVAALDSEPRMRAVLALFEGVATGAADGYARMADKPAATLLHLGCGLGNGLANLHNARKGKVPVVNIVGDHATYHTQLDAQLQSDIETVARNVSPGFVRTSARTAQLCQDATDAIAAARGLPGQVATLILPADVSWGNGAVPCPPPPQPTPQVADAGVVQAIAEVVRSGKKTALLLGRHALRAPALMAAARIAAHSGVQLLAEVFPTRMERGAGLPYVERIAYHRAPGAGRSQSPRVLLCLPWQKKRAGARDLYGAHARYPGPECRCQPGATGRRPGRRADPARPAARATPGPPARQAHRAQGLQGGGPPAARQRHPPPLPAPTARSSR